jgi:hypothetical protein
MSVTAAAVGLVALVVMHVAVLACCSWIVGHLHRGDAQGRRRVVFAPDGRRYELDLPAKNARALHDPFSSFVAAARYGRGRRRHPGRGAPRAH